MIKGTRQARETTLTMIGCRRTTPAHRCHIPFPGTCGGARNLGSRTQWTRCLSRPRSAGSSEIAPSTAATTPTAEARPSAVTRGMPATYRESSAITTVPPANTMALPEVATALAMESFIGMPSRSCS